MGQRLAIGGDKTRLLPGDITQVREINDGSLVSLFRGDSQLLFEADGGPYGEKEYFFPCGPATAKKIVSAIQAGEDYLGIACPSPVLVLQSEFFYAIANGVIID